jgi:hypothetical protein
MMTWQKYRLAFRLLAPLHIGYRTSGNLMQTRGYVPGRVLWAALTARLTRDEDNGADAQRYIKIGQQVQEHFRFTYLYPATQNVNGFETHYPWDDDFDYLFLNSYASTALNYASQSAEEAMLHETEFISPHTRTGQSVFLVGNVYTKTDLPAPLENWPKALEKIQLGAERGYGWGRVRNVSCDRKGEWFNDEPAAELYNGHITAHLKAEKVTGVVGSIEPLIGWERNNDANRKSNWRLSEEAIICYAPGAKVTGGGDFTIGPYGVWE